MEISGHFKIGDHSNRKLERAQACARELSSIECSWHARKPTVLVNLDDEGDLKWTLNDVCCEAFGRELSRAIDEVMPKL